MELYYFGLRIPDRNNRSFESNVSICYVMVRKGEWVYSYSVQKLLYFLEGKVNGLFQWKFNPDVS